MILWTAALQQRPSTSQEAKVKIGLETESCHLLFQHGYMDVFGFIDYVAASGLDGVQLNLIPDHNLDPTWGVLAGNNPEYLNRVSSALVANDLYCELDTRGTTFNELAPVLEIAHALGARLVRSYVRYPHDRFDDTYLASQVAELRRIVPLLRRYNIRLAIENHEFETSADVINFVTAVGEPDWVGVLCDVGNPMMAWEDPLAAVQAMAPYAFGVHFKDHGVIMDEGEPVVCGFPLGEGSIDLDAVFRTLMEGGPDRISLETCFPYCGTFKRVRGTGGVHELRETFAVLAAPFPSTLVRPSQYYYPHHAGVAALAALVEAQQSALIRSLRVVSALRATYARE